MLIEILTGIFKMTSPIWSYISYLLLGFFIIISIVYFITKKIKKVEEVES